MWHEPEFMPSARCFGELDFADEQGGIVNRIFIRYTKGSTGMFAADEIDTPLFRISCPRRAIPEFLDVGRAKDDLLCSFGIRMSEDRPDSNKKLAFVFIKNTRENFWKKPSVEGIAKIRYGSPVLDFHSQTSLDLFIKRPWSLSLKLRFVRDTGEKGIRRRRSF